VGCSNSVQKHKQHRTRRARMEATAQDAHTSRVQRLFPSAPRTLTSSPSTLVSAVFRTSLTPQLRLSPRPAPGGRPRGRARAAPRGRPSSSGADAGNREQRSRPDLLPALESSGHETRDAQKPLQSNAKTTTLPGRYTGSI
jgi:cell wall-associated NlpC family hydrolase